MAFCLNLMRLRVSSGEATVLEMSLRARPMVVEPRSMPISRECGGRASARLIRFWLNSSIMVKIKDHIGTGIAISVIKVYHLLNNMLKESYLGILKGVVMKNLAQYASGFACVLLIQSPALAEGHYPATFGDCAVSEINGKLSIAGGAAKDDGKKGGVFQSEGSVSIPINCQFGR